MPKYEATLYGHRQQYRSYRATVEVEAENEESAEIAAQTAADNGEVSWEEEPSDYSETFIVEVDSVDINEYEEDNGNV